MCSIKGFGLKKRHDYLPIPKDFTENRCFRSFAL
jgi:hypothetical protein